MKEYRKEYYFLGREDRTYVDVKEDDKPVRNVAKHNLTCQKNRQKRKKKRK